MSKMSELSMMLDELIACGTKLAETAMALKEFYSSDVQEQPAPRQKDIRKKNHQRSRNLLHRHRIRHRGQSLQRNIPRKMSAKSLPQKSKRSRGHLQSPGQGTGPEMENGGLTNVKPEDYAALAAKRR